MRARSAGLMFIASVDRLHRRRQTRGSEGFNPASPGVFLNWNLHPGAIAEIGTKDSHVTPSRKDAAGTQRDRLLVSPKLDVNKASVRCFDARAAAVCRIVSREQQAAPGQPEDPAQGTAVYENGKQTLIPVTVSDLTVKITKDMLPKVRSQMWHSGASGRVTAARSRREGDAAR